MTASVVTKELNFDNNSHIVALGADRAVNTPHGTYPVSDTFASYALVTALRKA